ncbi:MAG: hypothetical protein SGI72_11625 [Planctomycetota bacterium]|nr:hypothetical protein [Planctomycetota bacterium]
MSARAIFASTVLASLASVFAASCSRSHAPTSAQEVSAQSGGADFVLAQAPIQERMRLAPTTVRHSGTRRLVFHYDIAGVAHTMRYEERMTADGTGRFAIDPLRVVEPAMTVEQHEVFELLQKNREGFFHRFRDFGVRQRDLFLANYRIVDLHTNPVVVGRACNEFEVERKTGTGDKYRLAVDVQTALVLRSIEFAESGGEVARVEFVDFTLDPVLDNVAWFTPRYDGTPFDPANHAAAGLAFKPHVPRLLPAGYQHLHSEILRDAADEAWLRHVYSDGVENLLVLEKTAHVGVGDLATPTRSTSRTQQPEEQTASVPTLPAPYKVRLMNAGALTIAEVEQGGSQLFVVGKISEDDVLRVLKSAR